MSKKSRIPEVPPFPSRSRFPEAFDRKSRLPDAESEVRKVIESSIRDTLTDARFKKGGIDIDPGNERILFGSATGPLTGNGIYLGEDGQGNEDYDARFGDPGGEYVHFDASTGKLTHSGSQFTATNPTFTGNLIVQAGEGDTRFAVQADGGDGRLQLYDSAGSAGWRMKATSGAVDMETLGGRDYVLQGDNGLADIILIAANLGIGGSLPLVPTARLDVRGSAEISGDLTMGGSIFHNIVGEQLRFQHDSDAGNIRHAWRIDKDGTAIWAFRHDYDNEHLIIDPLTASGHLKLPAGTRLYFHTSADHYIRHQADLQIFEGGIVNIACNNGDVEVPNVGSTSGGDTARLDTSGSILRFSSSLRGKDVQRPMTLSDAREIVQGIGPTAFWYKSLWPKDDPDREWFGFSAEDMDGIAPPLTTYDADGLPFGVDFARLTVPLARLVDHHDRRLEDHEARIAALESGA